jgi:hypothetical protein
MFWELPISSSPPPQWIAASGRRREKTTLKEGGRLRFMGNSSGKVRT